MTKCSSDLSKESKLSKKLFLSLSAGFILGSFTQVLAEECQSPVFRIYSSQQVMNKNNDNYLILSNNSYATGTLTKFSKIDNLLQRKEPIYSFSTNVDGNSNHMSFNVLKKETKENITTTTYKIRVGTTLDSKHVKIISIEGNSSVSTESISHAKQSSLGFDQLKDEQVYSCIKK